MSQQEWYTPKELAGLPGMPGTVQGVHVRAKRDKWESRKRAARGGGREYALSSLPPETQAALIKSETVASAPNVPLAPTNNKPRSIDRESLWDAYERRPSGQKEEAARRLRALQSVERLVENGIGRSKAVVETAGVFGESRATLYRWQKAVKGLDRSDWLAALVPSYAGQTNAADITPAAWEFFKACYLRPEAPSVAACYEWTKEAARENDWQVPSRRTILRWANEIPRTLRVLKREGEYALLRLYPSQQRTVRDMHALHWINGDGYQHNVFVKMDPSDPEEKPWRPKTWFWQDIFSRRFVAWRTDRTEHTDVIRLSLGDLLEDWGIPDHATIDNTRAAANKWITGGVPNRYRFKIKEEDPIGLMPQLGIQVHWTTVHNGKGHGQAKPVERAFGVGGLGEYVDKHPRLAGCYSGPNVMAKPENYQDRAVSFKEFCEVLADAIRSWNQREGRRTEMAAGQLSFDQVFRQSYERSAHLIRRATEAQRRMWMLAAESVTVHKDASVALNISGGPNGKNRYACDALIEYVGRKLVVRFDPDHLQESVHLYQADGRYIGEAECIIAAGFGDTSAGREWRRQKKRHLKSAKDLAAAEVSMTALEAANYLPAGTGSEEEPAPQTNVYRGNWPQSQQARQVAGSDVVPDEEDEESPADRHRFNDQVLQSLEKWKRNKV